MSSQKEKKEAWLQNIRDNQIGGDTDGISFETAEDLGFSPPDTARSVGSGAMIATGSETERVRQTRDRLSMTPGAIRARERRARLRREADERMMREKGPFDTEFGGR